MGNSAIQQILATTDEKVKASLTDNTPDFLDGKVDGTSVDVNGSDKLAVLPAGVDHNSLNNYDANKHVDHTAVSISAGAGLTGGGTIAANRSLAVNPNGLVDTTIAAGDEIIFGDVTDSNNPKKDTVQGILDLIPAGGGIPQNIQYFASSGTWIKPVGISRVFVRVWGGGGTGSDGGGGGAGYSEGFVTVTGNVTVTVGAEGNPGGTSSFAGSTTPQATGGSRGLPFGQGSAGGAGGSGSGGSLNLTGMAGVSGSGGQYTGRGGSSPFGGVGGGGNQMAQAGGFPGAGGGNAAGAGGLVIVSY